MSIRFRPPALAKLATCGLILVLAVVLALGGCGTIPAGSDPRASPAGADRPTPSIQTTDASPSPPSVVPPAPTPSAGPGGDGRSEPPLQTEAVIGPVPPAQWAAMKRAGMVRGQCPVTQRSQLRRIDVPYVDFRGDVGRGHLIVRSDTAASTARIFTRLFQMRFAIRRMEGVEAYGGDVYKSLTADNTSAYNCRRAGQINAPFAQSPHANGRAIDINPVENPWKDPRCRCWSPTGTHAARTPGPGKILKNDPVWRLFYNEGWIWQNIDVPDYMHFDTGYPSKPAQPSQRQ